MPWPCRLHHFITGIQPLPEVGDALYLGEVDELRHDWCRILTTWEKMSILTLSYSETAKTPQVSVEDYETQHMDPIKATFCRVLRAFPVPQTL